MGVPLWQEKVGPNYWYGFRTPSTIRNEQIWYPVSRVTERWTMATGAVSAPVIVATFLAGLTADQAALTNLVPILVGVMVVHGLLLVRRLKRQLADSPHEPLGQP